MRRATVFGARGFLGRTVSAAFAAAGWQALALGREDWPPAGSDLGDIVFAIGMNANFRGRPFETYDAHIAVLADVLRRYAFKSLLYVSSTRVYLGAGSTAETAPLVVEPGRADQTFNISKLAGEALCLAQGNPAIRIARVSNLHGAEDRSDVFLTAVMREAIATGSVTFRTAPDSAKDYLHVSDAAEAILRIVQHGTEPIYNVASGQNRTNAEIATLLEGEGVICRFEAGAPTVSFPPIDVRRLGELGVTSRAFETAAIETYRAMKKTLKESAAGPA